MEVVLTLADHCGIGRTSTSYPARTWCNSFPERHFPVWRGNACDEMCVSGYYGNSCDCFHGYWGASCENVCPHVNGLSCGDGSACNVTDGSCTCPPNFDSTQQCDACSSGWYGIDCSSARTTVTGLTNRACVVSGLGHYTMFDGQTFSMMVAGEFVMARTSHYTAYIRQLQCGDNGAVCVKELWVETPTSNFTVQAPLANQDGYSLWHDGNQIQFDSTYTITSGVTLTKESQNSITIQSTGTIKVTYEMGFLRVVNILNANTQCTGVEGLCGNCDGNFDNDFMTSSGPIAHGDISKKIIDGEFAEHWKIGIGNPSGFIYEHSGVPEPREMYGDGFSVFYNGSGSYSQQLDSVFGTNSTMELKFNAKSDTGLIAAYQHSTNMVVYLNSTLRILWGGVEIDSHYTIQTDRWYHLTIMYSHVTNQITIYLFDGTEIAWWLDVPVTINAFTDGGFMRFGGWKVNAPRDFPYFYGQVDEIRIWNNMLDNYDAIFSSTANVNNTFDNLTALWNFHRGSGYSSYDVIGNRTITLPSDDVFWVPSDLDQTGNPPVYTVDNTIKEIAKEKCRAMIYGSPANSLCTSLGSQASDDYYNDCVYDIVALGNMDAYTMSLMAYSEFCQDVLAPSPGPIENLCLDQTYSQLLDDQAFQTVCTEYCKFGSFDTNRNCVCHLGYYGNSCNGTCPGGATSPCNLHGLCDQTTGQCYCEPTFDPATDCGSCKAGWTGTSCNYIDASPDPTPTGGSSSTQTTTAASSGTTSTVTSGSASTSGITSATGTTSSSATLSSGTTSNSGTSGSLTTSGSGKTFRNFLEYLLC